MACVTGGAGALAAVQVYAANTGVGPGGRINLAFVIYFYNGSVTVEAACFAFVVGIHTLVEPGIKFPHDFDGVGMSTFGPVSKNARCGGLVTCDAGLGFWRHAAFYPVFFDFGKIGQ